MLGKESEKSAEEPGLQCYVPVTPFLNENFNATQVGGTSLWDPADNASDTLQRTTKKTFQEQGRMPLWY